MKQTVEYWVVLKNSVIAALYPTAAWMPIDAYHISISKREVRCQVLTKHGPGNYKITKQTVEV